MSGLQDTVEFVLKLKDLTQGGFKSAAAQGKTFFSNLENSIFRTSKKLEDLGKGSKVKVDTSDIEKAARQVDNLNNKINRIGGGSGSGSGAGGGFSMGKFAGAAAIGNFAANAAMWAGRQAFDIGKSALDQGMNAERMIVGLSTFVGDQQAKAIYNQLQMQAVRTPFTSTQLLGVERGILPYRNAGQANTATMGLANAVAATGGSDYTLERMGWHLQQIAAMGHMEKIQEREFGFASIPIAKLIGDAYGMTRNQVEQKMKQHAITFDMVSTALEKASKEGGMFAGAMDKLSQTIYGKWTTIKDFWQIGEQKLTLSQSDNIKRLEDVLINGLQKVPEMVGSFAPYLTKAIEGIQEFLPTLKSMGQTAWQLVKPLVDFSLGDNMKELRKSLGDLVVSVGQSLIPAVTNLANALEPLAKLTSRFANGANTIFSWIAEQNKDREDYNLREKYQDEYNLSDFEVSRGREMYLATKGYQFHNTKGFLDWVVKDKMENGLSSLPRSLFPAYNMSPSPYVHPMGWDPNNPAVNNNAGAKGTGANGGADADTKASGITGGGRKQVIVNINKSMIETFTINAKEIKEGLNSLEHQVEEILLRILQSANAIAD